MLIQHLEALGTHGLDSSVQLSVIEIHFDLAKAKKDKLEVPYEVIRRIDGTNGMIHVVDKIDPSNCPTDSSRSSQPTWSG
jgi:hypothetical protein